MGLFKQRTWNLPGAVPASGNFKCEALLSATGRCGTVEGLNLEKVGIKTGASTAFGRAWGVVATGEASLVNSPPKNYGKTMWNISKYIWEHVNTGQLLRKDLVTYPAMVNIWKSLQKWCKPMNCFSVFDVQLYKIRKYVYNCIYIYTDTYNISKQVYQRVTHTFTT